MKMTILATAAACFVAVGIAHAGARVVCMAPVKPHGTTQAVVGAYHMTWQSRIAGDWYSPECQSANACSVKPLGGYTFAKRGSRERPETVPAGVTCAIFRNGQLDKLDPFNVATGVAATGLPQNFTYIWTWDS